VARDLRLWLRGGDVVILKALGKTAIKWLLIAVAFVVLLSAINYGLGFVPFTPQWRAKGLAAKADRLEGQVSTLEREAAGQTEIATATETFHTRETIIREGVAAAVARDRSAPDATIPLTTERANRLHDADRVLCHSTGRCPAYADAAGGSPEAVPDSDAPG
jgi:hypothetical protein